MKKLLLLICALGSTFAMAEKDKPNKAAEKKTEVPSLEAILSSVQKQYDKVGSFSADFTQEFHHKVLKKKESSYGKVKFKKPGMMRWDYEKPSEKAFIMDGKSLWIYQPKDKSVMVNKCFKEDKLTASLSFLWGQGDISKTFDAKFFSGKFGSDTDLHVQITPKEKSPYYKRIVLVIDPKSYQIMQSVVVDLEGNINQFIFNNLSFEGNIADKEFSFVVPKGVVESKIPGSDEDCQVQKKPQKKGTSK